MLYTNSPWISITISFLLFSYIYFFSVLLAVIYMFVCCFSLYDCRRRQYTHFYEYLPMCKTAAADIGAGERGGVFAAAAADDDDYDGAIGESYNRPPRTE